MQGKPALQYGVTAEQPVLPVPGEIFALRKLLPQTADYDFNIHIMDFKPGEHLNVKVHTVSLLTRPSEKICEFEDHFMKLAVLLSIGCEVSSECRRFTTTSMACCFCKARESIAWQTTGKLAAR